MSTQNNTGMLVDEIISNASTLPYDCQVWVLDVVKGMAFTKKCLTEQQEKGSCAQATLNNQPQPF